MKTIPEFNDKYSITESGKVWSHLRDRFLKPEVKVYPNGYKVLRVSLKTDKKYTRYLIHRLVAITFLPNPENLPVVDHINRNPIDNRLENLRWCTSEQNRYNMDKSRNKKYTSQYKGVYYDRTNKQYVSYGYYKNGRKYLGVSQDPKKLALIYNKWAKEKFGEFAVLNDVPAL